MKTRTLRYFGLAALVSASAWAVCGAEDISGRRSTSTVLKMPASPVFTSVAAADQDSTTRPTVTPPTTTTRFTPASTVAVQMTPTQSIITTPSPVAPSVPAVPAAILAPRSPAAETGSTIVTSPDVRLSLSTLSPTPEMWFYERMRQDYDNPALQARLRGERAAAERRARLAARAWYGVSNGRPMAHTTPFTYYYSPFWASNTVNPYFWTQPRTVPIIVEARRPTIGVSGFGMW